MLKLPIGGDLALTLHDIIPAAVHAAEHLESDGTNDDQQQDDDQERHQQLRMHRGGYARDKTDQAALQR